MGNSIRFKLFKHPVALDALFVALAFIYAPALCLQAMYAITTRLHRLV